MRSLTSLIMVLCFAVILPLDAHAKKNHAQKQQQPNNKYASIIIDSETGAVISERNADKVLYPASLTKVMTLLLLFEAMESGNVRLNDKIYISQRAANQSPSKIGLPAGSSIRVEDAILSLVTKSANDISVAIAEHLAGTESRFAQRMTARAQNIGMRRTKFRNASGLPDPGQVSSARDMATLARYIIVRYPNYYRYFGTKQFTYRGKTHTNHNRLMQTYPGMDGFKTGFINASGFNLIASAKRGNGRLIGVVFGGRTTKSRNDHMAELLNTGFRNMSDMRYANRNVVPVAPSATAPIATAAAIIPAPPPKPEPQTEQVAMVQLPPAAPTTSSFTSLESLDRGTKLIIPPAQQMPVQEVPNVNVTEDAIADVKSAINSGEYSEVTGQGDYDIATTRRLEAGLLSAAVYKGEKKFHTQKAAANNNAVRDVPQNLAEQLQARETAVVQPVAYPAVQQPSASDLWSIQIGAYNSRVATDDALRRAAAKLPANLTHTTPIVVPLTTGEGVLFRARLGNFTKDQAVDACRYFRDCLPVAPR